MFGFIFKKKVEVSKPSFKAEPTDLWETCFHKRIVNSNGGLYYGRQEWEEWKQIKYSGKSVNLDCKILYECSVFDTRECEYHVVWLPKTDLRFPE